MIFCFEHRGRLLVRGGAGQRGFTLIEVLIVTIVSTMILLGLGYTINSTLARWEQEKTLRLMVVTKDVLQRFYGAYNRYPCPAIRGLAVNHPSYGIEDCAGAAASGVAGQRVLHGLLPIYFVMNGGRLLMSEFIPADEFLIDRLLDNRRQMLDYAVTESQANVATFNQRSGRIRIEDADGNLTGGVTAGNLAHYVYIVQGKIRRPDCVTGPVNFDQENCDDDDTFIVGPQNHNLSSASYLDDYVGFGLVSGDTAWLRDGTNPHLYTSATGTGINRVGIGVANPAEALDVGGILRAAGQIRARQICTSDLSICLNPNTFVPNAAGANGPIRCAAPDQYIRSITYDATTQQLVANCEPLQFVAPTANTPCVRGVAGIFTNGQYSCVN
jgi:prepilin-type N-terminal cleavage/methylation domain-containing protein